MAAVGLTRNNFADLRKSFPAEQSRDFCTNGLDAIVYSVDHPNGLIRDATLTYRGMLVSVSGKGIDRMLFEYKEYVRVVLPGGIYLANPAGVRTFGVRAVVVTTKRMPDTTAYETTRAIFGSYDDFRRLNPAFKAYSDTEMVRATERGPVHAGVARYYRVHGWLK